MKTTTLVMIAGLGLATTAHAGTPVAPAPAPSVGLWTWFAGASAGYLTDTEEGLYNLQLGMEYRQPGDRASHAIYLEVGFAQDDEDYAFFPGIPGGPPITGGRSEWSSINMDIVPITLNYKYEATLAGHLDYYVGLGVGIAIVDTSCDWHWSQVTAPPAPFSGSGSDDQTDVRFYGQVFAGLAYHVSDAFQIYAGARYIFMDNVNRDVRVNGDSYDAGLNCNVLIELGVRYHF